MTSIIYRAMIPINPKTKKNNQQIRYKKEIRRYGSRSVQKQTPFISQSDAYKQYENDSGWFLTKIHEPISVPVNVRCIFYRDSAQRCDLTNLLEAIDDILVKYGILKDDDFKILAGHDGSRVYVDRENPRTEIYIELMEFER